MAGFIECTSLNISYDVLGVATVSYTIVTDEPELGQLYNSLSNVGGQTFTGYITNASVNKIPNTEWYEIRATLIATTG